MDVTYRAWQTGEFTPQAEAHTFADGIAARVPCALPVNVMRERLDAFYTVDEESIVETVAEMFREERILMEGMCAPPFAILEELRDEIAGKTIAIPVTGRNLPGPKVERVLSNQ